MPMYYYQPGLGGEGMCDALDELYRQPQEKKKEDVMEITADVIGKVRRVDNHFILLAECELRVCDNIKELAREVEKLLRCRYPEEKKKDKK